MNWRKIFVISIIVICIICLNLAVYLKFIEKDNNVNREEEAIVDTIALKENFDNIFDNRINYQNYLVSSAIKQDSTKELVYTNYIKQEKIEEKYEINVNIPKININNTNVDNINKEIENVFYTKVNSILSNVNSQKTIYSVKYKAYVNDNILSLIISADLKEGLNSQRLIIKTYNYNISANQVLDINQILNYRSLNSKNVQSKISETIKESQKTSSAYQELGYNKYLRDVNDEIYKIENTKVFFLGENKALYIIYPYGNSNYTTEMDLVVI